jgi:hypothetical protein
MNVIRNNTFLLSLDLTLAQKAYNEMIANLQAGIQAYN